MPDLTHLSATGQAHMVDISGKAATERVAIAEGSIVMHKATLDLALSGNAKKRRRLCRGQVIAAIMAAKEDARSDPALPSAGLDQGFGRS